MGNRGPVIEYAKLQETPAPAYGHQDLFVVGRVLKPMPEGVFHQGLYGEPGQLFLKTCLLHLVLHLKPVRETDFLDCHIIPYILQFLPDRHQRGRLHGIAHHQ